MTDDRQTRYAALIAAQTATEQQIAVLAGDLAAIVAASESSNADDEHDPEGATIAFERARTQSLLDAAQARRGTLATALARLDAGAYGVCEVCGEAIPPERLAARPDATRCVACATA